MKLLIGLVAWTAAWTQSLPLGGIPSGEDSGGGTGVISRHDAADLGGSNGTTASYTASYTVGGGTNRLLLIGVIGDSTTDYLTNGGSVKYNGVTATQVAKVHAGNWTYLYCLAGPASGVHAITVSASANTYIGLEAVDYAGAAQTCALDGVNTSSNDGSLGFLDVAVTTTVAGAWGAAFFMGYSANNPPATGGLAVSTDGSSTVTWIRGSSPQADWIGEAFEIATTGCTSGLPCTVAASPAPTPTSFHGTTAISGSSQFLLLHNTSLHTYNTRLAYEPVWGTSALFDSNGAISPLGAYNFQAEWPGASSTIGGIAVSIAPA